MAYKIAIDGTTKPVFEVGVKGVSISAEGSSTWKLTLPPGPGVSGYALITDGLGVTSWAPVGAAADSTVPYYIPVGTTFTVGQYKQALFETTIEVQGTLEVNGILVEVS